MRNHARSFIYLVIATFSLLHSPASLSGQAGYPDYSTKRETQSGSVTGSVDSKGMRVWLGIPYATPPVGNLRWRAPRPPNRWNGVLQAIKAGPKCSQYEGNPLALVGSEDCLYLNIWSPSPASESASSMETQRLPVMVWIHGGGGVNGEGSIYNAARLAMSQNVVVVTINYRLGYFGRFTHPALRSLVDNDEDRSGNYSTLDQIQALRWIKQNIEAFGGDPGNISIFGESGGGRAVVSLLLSPHAKNCFHKAIIQSGKENFINTKDMDGALGSPDQGFAYNAQAVLINLLINDKKAADYSAAQEMASSMSNEDIFHYLHEKSPADFLAAHKQIEQRREELKLPPAMFYLSTILDGVVIPKGKIESKEDFNQVPVILGSNKDEHILFLLADPSFAKVGDKHFTAALKAQPLEPNSFYLANEYLGNLWRALSVDEIADQLAQYQPRSVFSYRLDWDIHLPQLAHPERAPYYTPHGVDLAFLFDKSNCYPCHLDEAEDKKRNEDFNRLSDAMMSYWAQFAATGNPGRGRKQELPRWESWDESSDGSRKFILLDAPSKGGLRMLAGSTSKRQILDQLEHDPRFTSVNERCDFLKKLLAHQFLMGLLAPEDYPSFAGGACVQSQSRHPKATHHSG